VSVTRCRSAECGEKPASVEPATGILRKPGNSLCVAQKSESLAMSFGCFDTTVCVAIRYVGLIESFQAVPLKSLCAGADKMDYGEMEKHSDCVGLNGN
jgi:hypothetical protein